MRENKGRVELGGGDRGPSEGFMAHPPHNKHARWLFWGRPILCTTPSNHTPTAQSPSITRFLLSLTAFSHDFTSTASHLILPQTNVNKNTAAIVSH